MTVKLKKIGNSRSLIIPKKVIDMCDLKNEVVMVVEDQHIIISAATAPRAGWIKQFESAIAAGEAPENDVFNGLSNEIDETEWTW